MSRAVGQSGPPDNLPAIVDAGGLAVMPYRSRQQIHCLPVLVQERLCIKIWQVIKPNTLPVIVNSKRLTVDSGRANVLRDAVLPERSVSMIIICTGKANDLPAVIDAIPHCAFAPLRHLRSAEFALRHFDRKKRRFHPFQR